MWLIAVPKFEAAFDNVCHRIRYTEVLLVMRKEFEDQKFKYNVINSFNLDTKTMTE